MSTASNAADGTAQYSYDDTNQITAVDHDIDARDRNYAWDETGNPDGTDDVVDVGNEVAETTAFDYEYDAAGNRTKQTDNATGDYQEYDWDHRGRLTEVRSYTATGTLTKTVQFGYDPLNRRIGKREITPGPNSYPTQTTYILDGQHIIATLSGNTVTRVILHGPQIDMVLAEETLSDSTTHWTLTDHLGTIRDVVTGYTITQHADYSPFGTIVNGSLSTLFTYTGREYDAETGLYHYRARYYDAALHRFISRDPIGFGGGDTNIYRYVGNEPISSSDPSGRVRIVNALRNALRCQARKKLYQRLKDGELIMITRDDVVEELNKINETLEPIHNLLAPIAVRIAVQVALDKLGVGSVKPLTGDEDKAILSPKDVETIMGKVEHYEQTETISGDSAISIQIDDTWELKLYKDGDSFKAAVGYHTQSASHYADALSWMIGSSPNSDNAECFGDFFITNAKSRDLVKELLSDGINVDVPLSTDPLTIPEFLKKNN